jgi:Fe2+ transport system protein FeoA
MEEMPLTNGKVGETYEVKRINHHNPDTTRLMELGIIPHSKVKIFRDGKPYILGHGDTRLGISHTLVERIFVYVH